MLLVGSPFKTPKNPRNQVTSKRLEAQQGWNPKATHLSDEFVTSFAPFSYLNHICPDSILKVFRFHLDFILKKKGGLSAIGPHHLMMLDEHLPHLRNVDG